MQDKTDMRDLMALVGHLLLRWGWMENRLRGGPIPVEATGVREMRNAICHGLEAAHADPDDDGEAHIRCRNLSGSSVVYSAAELAEAIRTLERAGSGR